MNNIVAYQIYRERQWICREMLILLLLLLVTYRQVAGQLACPLGVSAGFGNDLALSSESLSVLLDQSEGSVGDDDRNARVDASYCKLYS